MDKVTINRNGNKEIVVAIGDKKISCQTAEEVVIVITVYMSYFSEEETPDLNCLKRQLMDLQDYIRKKV